MTAVLLDPEHEHYPFCVVWTPIPVLSWLAPVAGHVGICDSQGRIYDFQHSFRVGCDRMLFGSPVKYWDISRRVVPSLRRRAGDTDFDDAVECEAAAYDAALQEVAAHFARHQVYQWWSNNCYSFVAAVLNAQPGHGQRSRRYSALRVGAGLVLWGRYISLRHFIRGHWEFLLVLEVAVGTLVLLVLLALLVAHRIGYTWPL